MKGGVERKQSYYFSLRKPTRWSELKAWMIQESRVAIVYSCHNRGPLLGITFCHTNWLLGMLVARQRPHIVFSATCRSSLFRIRFIRGFVPIGTVDRVGVRAGIVCRVLGRRLIESLGCWVLVAFSFLTGTMIISRFPLRAYRLVQRLSVSTMKLYGVCTVAEGGAYPVEPRRKVCDVAARPSMIPMLNTFFTPDRPRGGRFTFVLPQNFMSVLFFQRRSFLNISITTSGITFKGDSLSEIAVLAIFVVICLVISVGHSRVLVSR